MGLDFFGLGLLVVVVVEVLEDFGVICLVG
jgi:hypothetical protein